MKILLDHCSDCTAEMEPSEVHHNAKLKCVDCQKAARSRANARYRARLTVEQRQEIDRRKRSPEQIRARNLKYGYGISVEDWDRMHDEQLGRCALCLRTLAEVGRICVDHCHTTGKVRGLLCSPCNTLLGMAYEDTAVLQRAIDYIKEHQA